MSKAWSSRDGLSDEGRIVMTRSSKSFCAEDKLPCFGAGKCSSNCSMLASPCRKGNWLVSGKRWKECWCWIDWFQGIEILSFRINWAFTFDNETKRQQPNSSKATNKKQSVGQWRWILASKKLSRNLYSKMIFKIWHTELWTAIPGQAKTCSKMDSLKSATNCSPWLRY